MLIEGAPELPAPPGFQVFPGYSDRAARVRDGKLYQPLYTTDDTFFSYAAETRIVVVDVATDDVESVLEAPCPGWRLHADRGHRLERGRPVHGRNRRQRLYARAERRLHGDDRVRASRGRPGAAVRGQRLGLALVRVVSSEAARARFEQRGGAAASEHGGALKAAAARRCESSDARAALVRLVRSAPELERIAQCAHDQRGHEQREGNRCERERAEGRERTPGQRGETADEPGDPDDAEAQNERATALHTAATPATKAHAPIIMKMDRNIK